jgi:YVTN family beta-propeller protein
MLPLHRTAWFLLPLALCAARAEAGGTLLVLNKTDSTLSFVDPESGATLAVVGTAIGPHELAVSPSGKVAVVSGYGRERPGRSLTVIDLERRLPIDTLDLGEYARPHGIQFCAEDRVLVTCEQNRAVIEVDLKARKVARALATDQEVSHMLACTADGRAFVANIGSGSVSVLDLGQVAATVQVKTGAGAEGIAALPDGREVWVANRAADTLSVIDAKTCKVVAELPCGQFPIRVQLTPDGARALVSNAKSGDVAVFDVAARRELKRISMQVRATDEADQRLFGKEFGDSPTPVGILIRPDGKRAYVANTNADVITVLDLETLVIVGRLKAGREPDGLGWSPR